MKGFVLIELVVTFMISSLLALSLYNILFQMQKSAQYVDQVVDVDQRLSIIHERLQLDFNGLFFPILALPAKPGSKKMVDQKTGAADLPEQTSLDHNIAKVLYSANQADGLLQECSFITSNPLQSYGEVVPRVARVIYILNSEYGRTDSFKLQRQQALDLDYQAAKSDALRYTLANGIRRFTLTYFYQTQKSDKDSKVEQQSELNVDSDSYQASKDGKSETKEVWLQQPPTYIKVDLSLWHDQRHTDWFDFELWYQVFGVININQDKIEVKREVKKDDKKVNIQPKDKR